MENFTTKKGLMINTYYIYNIIYIYVCVNKDLTTKIEVHLQILIAESWEKWELTTEAWI